MATGHRKERPQGLSGGVGGVSGIGARVESFLHYYNVLARFWASNHATNFEPYDIRYLQRHPEINTLVSQASQVEEKCFRSKRPNFASKNAFSPSVPPFGRRRLLRASGVGLSLTKEREQKSRPPIGDLLFVGSPCWTRTSDTLINSQVLYRLS